MKFDEIIERARKLTEQNICIKRTSFFSSLGRGDKSEFGQRLNSVKYQLTDVVSARPTCVFNLVRNHAETNIYRNDCALAEHSSLQNEGLLPPDSETWGWVEQYESKTQKGKYYFEIVCVARTRCGVRFTLTKELMHIYSGTVKGRIRPANSLLKCANIWRTLIKDEESKNIDSETAAFYQAIEVMIPWKLRSQLETLKKKFEKENENVRHLLLAQAFMIPVKIVEHIYFKEAFDNEDPYCGFSAKVNRNCTFS
jgi:hypothetical protein